MDQFVATRRGRWSRLETLLGRARGGHGRSLTADELEELGRLYRQATSDLAIARRDFPRDRVTRYLEQLAGRAHPAVYRREAAEWSRVWLFFATGFPRSFRDAAPFTALAFALFAGPLAAAFAATLADPIVGRVILPHTPLVDQIEKGQSWLDVADTGGALAASMIMTNNIQVAFLAFAGGVLFGLGTAYVLVQNGLTIGAVAGLAANYGLGGTLGGFVAPHSGIELTVIFIAGGAGLRLGHALLAPGLLSRRVALTEAAHKAVRLLFGCVPLLILAGLLEGFVSPSDLSIAWKLAVGAGATVVLYAYLLGSGRTSKNVHHQDTKAPNRLK